MLIKLERRRCIDYCSFYISIAPNSASTFHPILVSYNFVPGIALTSSTICEHHDTTKIWQFYCLLICYLAIGICILKSIWHEYQYLNFPKICIPRVVGHSTALQNSSPSLSQNIHVITLAYLLGKYALLNISFRCSLSCATGLKRVRKDRKVVLRESDRLGGSRI